MVATTAVLAPLAACDGASGDDADSPSSSPAEVTSGELVVEWYAPDDVTKSVIVQDVATGERRVAARSPGDDVVHADWSPDGERIAFEVISPNRSAVIGTVGGDGGWITELARCDAGTRCLQLAWPAWSPDGGSLAAVRYDVQPDGTWGPSHLVLIDAATGASRSVAATPDGLSAYYRPRWSPDGRRLVAQLETYPDVSQTTVATSRLVVVATDGSSEPRALTPRSLSAASPDWHPSSDRIVFQTYDLGAFPSAPRSELYLIDADDPSTLRRLTTRKDGPQRIGLPSWTPDGSAIVATKRPGGADATSYVSQVTVDPTTGAATSLTVLGAAGRLRPSS